MSTNKATIIYFFERVRIDKGDIVHIQPARSEEPQAIPRLMGISDKAKDLIKNTDIRGQKCRGAIASKLGVIILNMVMKEYLEKKTIPNTLLMK